MCTHLNNSLNLRYATFDFAMNCPLKALATRLGRLSLWSSRSHLGAPPRPRLLLHCDGMSFGPKVCREHPSAITLMVFSAHFLVLPFGVIRRGFVAVERRAPCKDGSHA